MCFYYKYIYAHSQVWKCTHVTRLLGELRSEANLSYVVMALSPKKKITIHSHYSPSSTPGSLFPASSNTGSVIQSLSASRSPSLLFPLPKGEGSAGISVSQPSSSSLHHLCSKGLQATPATPLPLPCLEPFLLIAPSTLMPS